MTVSRARSIPLVSLAAVALLAAVPGFAATVPSGVWVVSGASLVTPPWWHGIAVGLLALAALLAVLFARPLAPGLAALTLVTAVPLFSVLWLVVLLWLAIAVHDVILLVLRHRSGRPAPVGLAAAVVLATTAAWVASWASIDTWWYGSVGTVVVLLLGRAATSSVLARRVLGILALVLALLAAGAEGWHIRDRFGPG
jgi:hypothetical protein